MSIVEAHQGHRRLLGVLYEPADGTFQVLHLSRTAAIRNANGVDLRPRSDTDNGASGDPGDMRAMSVAIFGTVALCVNLGLRHVILR